MSNSGAYKDILICLHVYVKMDKGEDANLGEKEHGKDGGEGIKLYFNYRS